MDISYSAYQLDPLFLLNAKAVTGPRKGVLLRIKIAEKIGYSDLHPWVELGDDRLEKQLELLKQGRPSTLAQRSLELALLDAEYRFLRCSAFENKKIPPSHWLVLDLFSLTPNFLDRLNQQGFTHIKIKIGKLPIEEARFLKELSSHFSAQQFLYRLDANASLNVEQFVEFISTCGISERIDFVEDPVPFHQEHWKRLQNIVPLAADRYALEAKGDLSIASVLIIKPALFDLVDLLSVQRCVVTSYLAHPVEQMSAAYFAAKFFPGETAGLLTHKCYQPNFFSLCLQDQGPYLKPVVGTGWGFNELLEQLKWQDL